MRFSLSLQRALLGTVCTAILAGMIPAGMLLDHRLAAALEDRARADLLLAPRVFADRSAATVDAMMMHAKELAHSRGLADALTNGDRAAALRIVDAQRGAMGGADPVVIGPAGDTWQGPRVDSLLISRTRAGEMPVALDRDEWHIRTVALAPVEVSGRWVGAAGMASVIDERAAGLLSGLTRSGVVFVNDLTHRAAASTLDSAATAAIIAAVPSSPRNGSPREVLAGDNRFLAVAAPLGGVGTVVFTRALRDELAVLPELRRLALLSAAAALVLAVLLGAALTSRVSRPVRQLASAADSFARGSLGAPLPRSRVREVARVADAFDEMRKALAARLAELGEANAALTDRNARLTALQSDFMQRDRLAATGRLVAQLAHEIRNPVANLRNCLELIRRRVEHDEEAREFADLAIDELLRMHELAEQMLDLNRPRDPSIRRCAPVAVAREVAKLATAAISGGTLSVDVQGDPAVQAALSSDALKQILLNLVQNAREACAGGGDALATASGEGCRTRISVTRSGGDVCIEVCDNGPGIRPEILSRIFDPFFTTKAAVRGVGLGLFVAEGLVRTAGGRLSAGNQPDGGAWIRIELRAPAAGDSALPPATTDYALEAVP